MTATPAPDLSTPIARLQHEIEARALEAARHHAFARGALLRFIRENLGPDFQFVERGLASSPQGARCRAEAGLKSAIRKTRIPNEKYYTPHSLIRAFLNVEYFGGTRVIDPAAGDGKILDVLAERGIPCAGIDIAPDAPHIARADFLKLEATAAAQPLDILTNPPYGLQGRLAVRFIEHALDLTRRHQRKVAMLLHGDFDSAKTRRHLFSDHPAFVRQYTLTERIYWANFAEHRDRSGTNHAWFVWDWAEAARSRGPRQLYLHAPEGENGWR